MNPVLVLLLFATAVNADVALKIDHAQQEEIVEHYTTDFVVVDDLPVYGLDGTKIQSPRFAVQCAPECDPTLTEHDKKTLSIYASYIYAISDVDISEKVTVGILREESNTIGMFVLHPGGYVSFWVRTYDHGEEQFDVASDESDIVLLIELAAHERAHYDNYATNGEWGHGDEFQIVFNVLFKRAIDRIEQFKAIANLVAGVSLPPTLAEIALFIVIPLLAVALLYIVYMFASYNSSGRRLRVKAQARL